MERWLHTFEVMLQSELLDVMDKTRSEAERHPTVYGQGI